MSFGDLDPAIPGNTLLDDVYRCPVADCGYLITDAQRQASEYEDCPLCAGEKLTAFELVERHVRQADGTDGVIYMDGQGGVRRTHKDTKRRDAIAAQNAEDDRKGRPRKIRESVRLTPGPGRSAPGRRL